MEWRPSNAIYGPRSIREQRFDCLEQTITDLAQLMGFANKDREEERNLPRNLPPDRPNPIPILEIEGITFYDRRFLKKISITLLTELEVYFYFKKVPYH
jgi:hypothetical protein